MHVENLDTSLETVLHLMADLSTLQVKLAIHVERPGTSQEIAQPRSMARLLPMPLTMVSQ